MIASLALAAIGCALTTTPTATPIPPSPTPAAATATAAEATPALATATVPASGETYTDPVWGYSVTIPTGWEACTITENSRLYCPVEPEPTGPSFPVFYITVLPAGFTNEQAEAYNFLPEADVRGFDGLPVGETRVLEGHDPEFYTYTRLPDTAVAGAAGVTIENSRVWEGGPETVDRRVLITRGDRTYMIGTYYESQEALAAFESILATFEVAP
jgi:hypothetical protein